MSVGSNPSAAVDCLPQPADNSKEVLICHEKGWSKSVLVYALHSLENVLGLARFRVFVPNMYVMSLLSSLSKIFQKVLKDKLCTFINEENVLPVEQFGFREFEKHIEFYFNQQKSTDLVFLDVEKAFDSVLSNWLSFKTY